MKVRVKDNYLNVRVGAPSVNAPCYQYLAPGSEIEVEEKLYKGDKYGDNEIDTWFRDVTDNYYWSGGVNNISTLITDTAIIDYGNKSSLPPVVKNTKGTNVRVGILDTGCFKHQAFGNLNIRGNNFIDRNNNFDDTSVQSHGTFVAGIIAAGQCTGNKMLGVAPNVSLIVAKIASNASISNRNAVLDGLKWIIQQGVDIINCSFDFAPAEDLSKFNSIFQSVGAQKIIWIAAGHDNEGVFNKTIFYPAAESNFIAIGSVRRDLLTEQRIKQINPKIKYLIEESQFISTDNFGLYKNAVGSSFGSALVSGNMALVKSHLSTKGLNADPKDCIDFFDRHTEQILSPLQLNESLKIFKV